MTCAVIQTDLIAILHSAWQAASAPLNRGAQL